MSYFVKILTLGVLAASLSSCATLFTLPLVNNEPGEEGQKLPVSVGQILQNTLGRKSTSEQDQLLQEAFELTNVERQKQGLSPLKNSSTLTKMAQSYAEVMASQREISHEVGSTLSQRREAVGYTSIALGENVAAGQTRAEEVVTGWMNSPGHRANILRPGYTELGMGLAYDDLGTPYWVQNFGGDS